MISVAAIIRKTVVAVVPAIAVATIGTAALLAIRGIVGVGPGSLTVLAMLAAGIAAGHSMALLALRRWLSSDALSNRRSVLAGALSVLGLIALALLGPDFLGMSEAAWRRLGPLQPFIMMGVAAVSGGLGALAMYFPWLEVADRRRSHELRDPASELVIPALNDPDLGRVHGRKQRDAESAIAEHTPRGA